MATATRPLQSVPVEKIAEHADTVRPGVIIIAVITAFFFGIGWTVGAAWRGIVFCCLAIRYGYRQGAHVTVAPAQPPQG